MRSPVSTERSGPATSTDLGARADRRRRRRRASDLHVGSSCANTSVAHAVPASTPSARATMSADAARVGGHERGGEVAEGPDVLGQRRARPASRTTCDRRVVARLDRDGSGSVAGAGRTRARARRANTRRPRNSARRSGIVDAGVRAARLTARGRGADQRGAHREEVGAPRRRSAVIAASASGRALEALGVAQRRRRRAS